MIPFHNFQIPTFVFKVPYWSYNNLKMFNQLPFQPQIQNQQFNCVGLYTSIENLIQTNRDPSFQNSSARIVGSNIHNQELDKENHVLICKKSLNKNQNQQKNQSSTHVKKLKKLQKIKYLKKNTESNISNQVLAFLISEQKSEKLLSKICRLNKLDEKQIIPKYYTWTGVIKNKIRKYVSKKILLSICISSSEHMLIKQLMKLKMTISEFELQLFCRITRIMIKTFLNEFCQLTVLTSKKIHKQGVLQHLMRRRQIKNFLQEQLTGL